MQKVIHQQLDHLLDMYCFETRFNLLLLSVDSLKFLKSRLKDDDDDDNDDDDDVLMFQ